MSNEGQKMGGLHSARSDLWSLGAVIFNLASVQVLVADSMNECFRHLSYDGAPRVPYRADLRRGVSKGEAERNQREWVLDRRSRLREMRVPAPYSERLEMVMLAATTWEKEQRLDPRGMVRWINGWRKDIPRFEGE